MQENQELPQGWVWTTVGELAKTSSGGTPSRKNPNYFTGNIPWIKSGELGDGVVSKCEEFITEEAIADSSAKLFPKGTLLVALYGATVGKVGILAMDATTNQAVCGIFLPESVELQFAFHYLISIRRDLIAQGKGGAQPNISQDIVRTTPFPLPPLPEQRRIVAKLEELFSRLDAGVATLRQTQAQLKRYRQSVLHAAVTGELTRAWRSANSEPAESGAALLQRIRADKELLVKQGKLKKDKLLPDILQEEQPFPIPTRWQWHRLGNVLLKLTDGTHHSPVNNEKGEFRYITAKNIKQGRLRLDNLTYVSREVHEEIYSRCNPELGDLLYIKDGATTGISAINTIDEPFSMLSSVALLKCPKQIYNKYLHAVLSSSYFYNMMRDDMSGVAITRVTLNKLSNAPVQIPSYAEQEQIVLELESHLSTLDALEHTLSAELTRAERLRQSILHRAFTGCLVPQDAADEPAAVLLARLQEESAAPPAAKGKRGRKAKAVQTTLDLS